MLQYTFRPLPTWPHPTTRNRTGSPFRAGFRQTLDALEYEIGRLHGSNVIIGIGIVDADLRNDGMPRKNAGRPLHPGVELSFDTRDHGRLIYACDAFTAKYYGTEDWHANLRAIALGLEHLRTLDRYGIGRGQQYAGYAALPAKGMSLGGMSKDAAWKILLDISGAHGADQAQARTVYRNALHKAHPDTGGSDQAFHAVQEAARVLGVAS